MPATREAPRLLEAGRTVTGHLALAKSLFLSGRRAMALAEVETALAGNPELALAYYLRGLILYSLARQDEAVESMERSVLLDGEDRAAWLALAHFRFDMGEYRDSLSAVDHVLSLDSQESRGHFLRGENLLRLDRPDDATAAYRRALELNPHMTVVRNRLAHRLLETGRTEEAMEMITLGLRLNPADLDSRITLSEVLVQQGRTEEALIELRVAAQLFPSKALPLEKIADLSYRLNFLDDALAFYRLAIQVDERRVHAYVQSGRIFLERDRPAEAAEMLRAAITRDPRYPTAAELLEKAQLAADAKAR